MATPKKANLMSKHDYNPDVNSAMVILTIVLCSAVVSNTIKVAAGIALVALWYTKLSLIKAKVSDEEDEPKTMWL